MTIYKLFRNTAATCARDEFGERFFTDYISADRARDAVIREEVAAAKADFHVLKRSVTRDAVPPPGPDRVRVVFDYKPAYCKGSHQGFWYEIARIETEL